MPPRTIVVPGAGTQTLQAVLPNNLGFDVQSVVATIDASGSGDTTPILTVQEPSGEVIAGVPQDDPVPSGDTGLVTWALRLAGKSKGGTGTPLTTTDGFFTVVPTDTLLIGSGITLTPVGPTTAELSTAPPVTPDIVEWHSLRTAAVNGPFPFTGYYAPDWFAPTDERSSVPLLRKVRLGPGFPAGTQQAGFQFITGGTYLLHWQMSVGSLTTDPDAQFNAPGYGGGFHYFPIRMGNWSGNSQQANGFLEWPIPLPSVFGLSFGCTLLVVVPANPSLLGSIFVWFLPLAAEDPRFTADSSFVAIKLR